MTLSTRLTTIRNTLKSAITGITELATSYTVTPYDITNATFPVWSIVFKGYKNDRFENSSNKRTIIFDVKVYYPRDNDNAQTYEDLSIQYLNTILDTLESRTYATVAGVYNQLEVNFDGSSEERDELTGKYFITKTLQVSVYYFFDI